MPAAAHYFTRRLETNYRLVTGSRGPSPDGRWIDDLRTVIKTPSRVGVNSRLEAVTEGRETDGDRRR